MRTRYIIYTALALLVVCIPAVAQQPTVSAPLSANEVMERVVQMNEHRANALKSYSSIRSYHLECHCLSHKKADMVVRANDIIFTRDELVCYDCRNVGSDNRFVVLFSR